MTTPASSTSSPNSPLRIRIIQEIFNDYNGLANEQAMQQLNTAFEDRCPIIVIEPKRLASNTCQWIKLSNWIDTFPVPCGLSAVAMASCSWKRWWVPVAIASVGSLTFRRFNNNCKINLPQVSMLCVPFGLCSLVMSVCTWKYLWMSFAAISGVFYVFHRLSFASDPCVKYQIETDEGRLEKIYREINNQHASGNNLVVLIFKEDKLWRNINFFIVTGVSLIAMWKFIKYLLK